MKNTKHTIKHLPAGRYQRAGSGSEGSYGGYYNPREHDEDEYYSDLREEFASEFKRDLGVGKNPRAPRPVKPHVVKRRK